MAIRAPDGAKNMTKFYKWGGAEALCITTLKTDWICKNRVHNTSAQVLWKASGAKEKLWVWQRFWSFQCRRIIHTLWVSSNNNVMTFFEKSWKVQESTEALFSSERRWTIEELNIPPTSYGFSLRLTVGSVAYMSKYMPWFWSWIVVSSFANCKKKTDNF